METAIPSNDVVKTFKKIETESPTAEKVAETVDHQIGQLANDPRWLEFKEVIDGMIAQYEGDINIEPTDTPSQIGFKYMASRLVAGALKTVRDIPESIAKGEQHGGTEGQ